jgi:hypothetical protein
MLTPAFRKFVNDTPYMLFYKRVKVSQKDAEMSDVSVKEESKE